jgi:serine/threonine protein kinase
MIEENIIFKIAFNLSSGLKLIHSLKYAYRNLKPENILISLDGNFKISDFSSCTNRYYENINNHVK